MSILETFWGSGDQLGVLQMTIRAVVLFFITLMLLRLGGMQIFGRKTSFDTIIVIMMGALLSRVIVGASPFLPTVVATAAMVAINRFLSWLASINGKIDLLVKGSPLILFDDGVINWRNMKKANLSYSDLIESLRIETLKESLADIEKAYLETNGQISFVEKNNN
ncbi:Protein of unknown function [Chitinophaga terrae (ex Kim and Jung 2007)]|uniref:YetF C-terminal domain-containing protein n=1 Tax=Chitinophaga terrae (ex Kim and Jung 2007) TaxID=408074 RepID=A0A1H4D139_9BACT|nr:YetF domain-containing protein [Chitinophaga terrae (ex Kim and Jung 2007)]MDQ0108461.1 uncharacterized membrane protein YcaP (DUF421 family) [Chitinophaga terrae (ex Kim and Jung 2007)]GEP90630.1 hypothetical protein CTE07_22750 [Chitinophaga terrae (ex Kim and Jung 2007)]SEA66291.1 Protein of unknown function [Chitinophaga terrae (ex Kim and Jung 2007)]